VAEAAPIAAIVLAAGRSTRMGASNKLLADIGGRPMARVVVETVLASRTRPVLVVTGHQAEAVRAALAGLDVTFVGNPDYAAGLSTSLKAGLHALPLDSAGGLVVLGDMPRITAAHLDEMIAVFERGGGTNIVVPVHNGERGNPVLWPAAFFVEMLALEGDAGARSLLATHAGRVREVDLGVDAIFADIDTPEALAALRKA
jgi:molybdenum cofactor cytidylyltransferase